MYLHTVRPCAYHFTRRQESRGISQSVALWECLRWGCYQTTEELSRPKWEAHVEQVNGVSRTEAEPQEGSREVST